MTGRFEILDWLAGESAAFTGMAVDIWSHHEVGDVSWITWRRS